MNKRILNSNNLIYIYVIAVFIVIIGAISGIVLYNSSSDTKNIINFDKLSEEKSSELTKSYSNENYKFSLLYPDGLIPSYIETEEGEIVIFTGTEKNYGFQIVISYFDESADVLTAERIKKDTSITTIDPQEVLLGENGRGIAFLDSEGDSSYRQIWFVIGGNMYQITAHISFDAVLKKVMNTWEFNLLAKNKDISD